jgi:hypothetical protein
LPQKNGYETGPLRGWRVDPAGLPERGSMWAELNS